MFYVEIDGVASNWYPQTAGIRQGCPLSPYLFIILMTVLFHDIHSHQEQRHIADYRVKGATFDEVLYADGTICISEDETSMNWLLNQIESEGAAYGFKLNKTKRFNCNINQIVGSK